MPTKKRNTTERMAEGLSEHWKVPDDLMSVKIGDRGRYLLGIEGMVEAGKKASFEVSADCGSRIYDFAIDEPEDFSITSIIFGRISLAIEGGAVLATHFSLRMCVECRKQRVHTLVGNRWPYLFPGIQGTIQVRNIGDKPKLFRAAFICEEEAPPEENLGPYGVMR